MELWLKLFFAGWLFHSSIHSLEQDLIGQAKYVELVQSAWVSAWITVPMAIFMLCIVWMLVRAARNEIERLKKPTTIIVNLV